MLKTYTDLGTFQLLEQIKFLKGENTIDIAEGHGIGKKNYNLVDVDEHNDIEPDKKENTDDNNNKSILYAIIGALSAVCLILIITVIALCVVYKKKINNNIGSLSLVTKDEV